MTEIFLSILLYLCIALIVSLALGLFFSFKEDDDNDSQ